MIGLHVALCFVGLALVLVRLRIVAKPHPTLNCRIRWWAWVIAHALWACGLFAAMIAPLYRAEEASIAEWFIRTGVVIYLLLRIRSEPEMGK